MSTVKPVTPEDVTDHKRGSLPDAVLVVFNELIARDWDGDRARVYQDEAAEKIAAALAVSTDLVFARKYLDVEPIYRESGWHVHYDKPGYNESYRAHYIFKVYRG